MVLGVSRSRLEFLQNESHAVSFKPVSRNGLINEISVLQSMREQDEVHASKSICSSITDKVKRVFSSIKDMLFSCLECMKFRSVDYKAPIRDLHEFVVSAPAALGDNPSEEESLAYIDQIIEQFDRLPEKSKELLKDQLKKGLWEQSLKERKAKYDPTPAGPFHPGGVSSEGKISQEIQRMFDEGKAGYSEGEDKRAVSNMLAEGSSFRKAVALRKEELEEIGPLSPEFTRVLEALELPDSEESMQTLRAALEELPTEEKIELVARVFRAGLWDSTEDAQMSLGEDLDSYFDNLLTGGCHTREPNQRSTDCHLNTEGDFQELLRNACE